MGYRSTVVIGLRKEVLAWCLIGTPLPKILQDIEWCTPKEIDGVVYYRIEEIKWYQTYPEISEVESFLNDLDDLPNGLFPAGMDTYGAIRIGDNDDDVQEWGKPYAFDICIHRTIESPA